MTQGDYDVIVIGAGTVGENVADYATQGGMTVALVEAELVGGECSYWACMPSKALLRAGSVLRAARSVQGAAGAVTGGVDPAAVFARRTRITGGMDDSGQAEWVAGAGIDLIRGHARFTGVKRMQVTGSDGSVIELTARHAVAVCTGSAPLMPDIPGLADISAWSSRDATSATRAPASLAILGGGVVGVEMATAYASFGTRVTLISRGGLLAGNEPFAGELVGAALERSGVSVRSGVTATEAHRTASNAVLTLSDGHRVIAEEVLVATGRVPRTGDMGLETIGLSGGEWLEVDDTMRVAGYDWLYAVGDANHRALLTHQGKYQARVAGAVIAARAAGQSVDDAPWGRHTASADAASVPQVTFTDPEVASVGLTAEAAEKAGRRIRILDYDLAALAGATVHSDDYVGRARAIVDDERNVLIGATFVGPDVGEMLHAATIAIVGEVPLARLWHAVPSYPTLSEVWLRWLEQDARR
ncbi:MAG TPA: NAD(P)/FAD-dependent oxidoreductase [Pseudolysinimonas sp.]|nr:NAD(P)/FAD-dependent oxidoreductase [Pseudolysinimonas sp.]